MDKLHFKYREVIKFSTPDLEDLYEELKTHYEEME